MAETAEPPPTTEPLPNPVIKDNFADAKSAFLQARIDEGLDAPEPPESPEPAAEPVAEPPPPTKGKADAEPDAAPQPASVLPDDVFEPKETKKPSVIAEIEAAQLPKGAKKETIDSFNKLKTKSINELTQANSRIQEIERKLSEATTNKEVETLRERLKTAEQKATELEEGWAKTSLETSPQFQRQFVKREQQAIEAAKGYLEGTEVDPRIVDYAARVTGATRLKVLNEAGLDPTQVGAIEARLAHYDAIQRDKSEAVDHWREQGARWQEAEQQRVQQQMTQRAEFESKVWENVLNKNANLLPFRSSKDETWNSQAEAYKSEARDIFLGKGADPETMADVVQRGVVAKSGFYDKIIDHLSKQNKMKDEQISKLQSAAPGGGITTTAGTPPTVDESKLSREELSKRTFNDALAASRGGQGGA